MNEEDLSSLKKEVLRLRMQLNNQITPVTSETISTSLETAKTMLRKLFRERSKIEIQLEDIKMAKMNFNTVVSKLASCIPLNFQKLINEVVLTLNEELDQVELDKSQLDLMLSDKVETVSRESHNVLEVFQLEYSPNTSENYFQSFLQEIGIENLKFKQIYVEQLMKNHAGCFGQCLELLFNACLTPDSVQSRIHILKEALMNIRLKSGSITFLDTDEVIEDKVECAKFSTNAEIAEVKLEPIYEEQTFMQTPKRQKIDPQTHCLTTGHKNSRKGSDLRREYSRMNSPIVNPVNGSTPLKRKRESMDENETTPKANAAGNAPKKTPMSISKSSAKLRKSKARLSMIPVVRSHNRF